MGESFPSNRIAATPGGAGGGGESLPSPPVTATPLPPIPAYLLPVAAFRASLRRAVRDAPLDPSDPSSVLIPDDALDDALRAALAKLSLWRPAVRRMPDLALAPGVSLYPLPDDFAEPVERTWAALLGPDPLASGRVPGGRYALLRRQQALDAPARAFSAVTGGGFGYGGYGGAWGLAYGGCWAGGLPVPPEDAQGNLIAGGSGGYGGRPEASFYPASFDSPSPALVLTPAPAQGRTLTGLTYRAAHLPRRLSADPGTNAWAVDAGGGLLFGLAPLSQPFDDGTDVLPFAPSGEEPWLVLRYATYVVLSEQILDLSRTDGDTFAFYEVKTGLGRRDVQALADRALAEWDRRMAKARPGGIA